MNWTIPSSKMFFFETEQFIDQMDRAILLGERSSVSSSERIHEILRAMHSIRGSAATMKYGNIAELAHSLEDVLPYLREHMPDSVYYSELTDLVLEGSDFIKLELYKSKNGERNGGEPGATIQRVQAFN